MPIGRMTVLVPIVLALSLTGAQENTGASSIEVQQHDEYGRYLTDSEGRSLYLFTNDERGGESTCDGECAENWPPFTVDEAPTAGQGAAGSLIDTVEREDGSMQATYYGWPLHYFAQDEEPGDTAGHGVGGVWFLVSAYGQPIDAPEADADQAQGAAAEDDAEDGEEQEGKEAAAGDRDGGEEIPNDVMAQGSRVYSQNCAGCHGAEGGGGSGPRLAGNDNLENETRVVRQILHGGSFMPPFRGSLDDEQVAAVSTHIRNSWDNSFGLTTPEEVREQR